MVFFYTDFISAITKYGSKASWYKDISEVPCDRFTFFVANEFFDALPVHKFVRVRPDPGNASGLRRWRRFCA